MKFGTFIDDQVQQSSNEDWTGEQESVMGLKSQGWSFAIRASKTKGKSPFYIARNGSAHGVGPASSKIDWTTVDTDTLVLSENSDGVWVMVAIGTDNTLMVI